MSKREDLDELYAMIQTAEDRAHWLAVHRRMKLAGHIESLLRTTRYIVVDMRGRVAREERT